mmetsp:Transcript_3772/g.9156  ORF Transcript_3772/g.9156 Transcript_3772/m.9156 type:complete len:255 (-) Transcript_3772:3930-4694(-)
MISPTQCPQSHLGSRNAPLALPRFFCFFWGITNALLPPTPPPPALALPALADFFPLSSFFTASSAPSDPVLPPAATARILSAVFFRLLSLVFALTLRATSSAALSALLVLSNCSVTGPGSDAFEDLGDSGASRSPGGAGPDGDGSPVWTSDGIIPDATFAWADLWVRLGRTGSTTPAGAEGLDGSSGLAPPPPLPPGRPGALPDEKSNSGSGGAPSTPNCPLGLVNAWLEIISWIFSIRRSSSFAVIDIARSLK